MIPRSLITVLVVFALFLPVMVCVLIGIEALLGAMGDAAGSYALQRIRLASLVIWIADLIALLIVLGLQQLGPPPGSSVSSPPAE